MASTPIALIPAPLKDLLSLFEGPLEGVAFPDVDAASLAELGVLVEKGAQEVTDAEEMLRSARASLDERLDTLLNKAQRALAYARIFAQDDAELTAQLAAIALPRSARAAQVAAPVAAAGIEPVARKRGRPRKIPLAVVPAPAPIEEAEPMLAARDDEPTVAARDDEPMLAASEDDDEQSAAAE